MRRSKIFKLTTGLLAIAALAACETAPHTTAKQSPSNAYECRKEIYDNPEKGSMLVASGGGVSIGASLAIALVSAAATTAQAKNSMNKQLTACYDSVGAPMSERLPLDAATKRHDTIIAEGGSPADARRAALQSARGGSNGGAGFTQF